MSKEYVRAGFLTDLLGEWAPIASGDEWGDWCGAVLRAAEASISISDEETALFLTHKLLDSFNAAVEEEWGWYDDCAHDIKRARKVTDAHIAYWRKRAKTFDASKELEEEVAKLPQWIHPQPGDDTFVPEEDPEYRYYLRLKEKFEGASPVCESAGAAD